MCVMCTEWTHDDCPQQHWEQGVQGSAESEKAATDCNGYVAEEKQVTLLGVFAEMQKLTISFVMSVCLSVCMEQRGSQWMDFR
jgi:hypothetical protein